MAQKWQYLGLQIYYIFTQISRLKMVSNLALFRLATVLATFQKIGRFFSKSSGHPDGLLGKWQNRNSQKNSK
jgi:hypothetical protein